MSHETIGILVSGLGQTVWMVGLSCLFAVVFGLPLGVVLFATKRGQILSFPTVHRCLGVLVNIVRSLPFIVLMVAIIPFTRLIVGTSIGTAAATVPLTLAAIPFVARLMESAFCEVPYGLIEAAESMGASPWQIVTKILLPESMLGIIRAVTLTLVTLVGYSAMAGAVGGGGLGDIAIQYGYERFDGDMMLATVVILIALVQLLQWVGDALVRRWLAENRGV